MHWQMDALTRRLFEATRLQIAGSYAGRAFVIAPGWRGRQAVYVWTQGTVDFPQPIRVGIACGPKGMGGRYDHYNKWLDGRFKPDDKREQQVRRVFLEGLKGEATVWAVEMPDKVTALAVEKALRQAWGARLALDLMVKDSWGKQRMNAWRAEGRLPPGPC